MDFFSRLPLPADRRNEDDKEVGEDEQVALLFDDGLDGVNEHEWKEAMGTDTDMLRILTYVNSGWPKGHRRRGAGKTGVCVDFSSAHTDLRRYFPRGEVGVVFRRVDSLFLWIAGITRCPGSVLGFSCLFSGCASVCGAARRNYDLTAGVASISPLDYDLRGCALKLRSHGRRRVDFSSRGRAALSLRGRASDLRSSPERRVDQRRSAAFFSPQNKLCVEIFGARSVQVKERSLFGPETSRNRRQALSKPLESTFTARQEFSKAAGQQQGSSPL
ncbi:hypothetical protein NDU88_004361 [Pleurodeles waltl]|uniref:Uncharacterized protein n=1 Tax=Pleurodeles waltl TaxID=8319 RepID=A0AAV7QI43_PLEWA|nr:hypothetical protein NDU88_004361 [Pleurodeles waltl]